MSKERVIICKSCKKEHKTKSYNTIYCSTRCQQQFKVQVTYNKWILEGIIPKCPKTLKRLIKIKDPYKCSICNISSWNGKEIVLEMEHKDGNSENNHPDNLCLICPNCHSQTDTYKAKNTGNGRHSRRQRYAEGKSY